MGREDHPTFKIMQDWPRPLLRSLRSENVSEESQERELDQIPLVWRAVSSLFLHRFESEGMVGLLGSVLCAIPKSDFDKILAAYPFFYFGEVRGVLSKNTRGGRSELGHFFRIRTGPDEFFSASSDRGP